MGKKILIGPGLGTEPLVQSNVISIIHKLKAANLNVPLVIDADGLKLVAEHPGLIQDYRGPVYLTPNKREYENLLSGSEVNAAYIKQGHPNLTVIVKGHEDVIKNNQISLTCKEGNSWRRCGGQGDLVAGTLATFSRTSNPPNTPLHHDDLIPLPAFDKHKGQMGRICVIGGSVQYTGATFYASMSSLTA
ncbi:ATP-dependent (S)-NAD(P)H-hydrate dehydratase, partial [Diaphorina citri]|uniref:ATP-dependent NAD(P)H-hydrate dehydratase n=1 Tax=Diaphorina citri TaxID=121845 RepID=A0A3Q0JGG3_DIACI